jgi:hypothetical protein
MRLRRWMWVGLIGLSVFGFGCEKPLFPQNLPRTQFERYDRLRGRYTPAEQYNVFGGTEPALRDRLSPPPY